jgi:VWFA-related protein
MLSQSLLRGNRPEAGSRGNKVMLAACLLASSFSAATLLAQFRSGVDVIAVDVQVVDPSGNPIGEIGADKFEVSINGQRRKVVSAQFVRVGASEREGGGRTFILAVDSGSFEVGSERAPMDGARAFVQRLDPGDRIGLIVYPLGVRMAPTTERAPIAVNLARVVGRRDPLRNHFNLKAFEIVDITARSTSPNTFMRSARNPETNTDPGAQELDPVLLIQRRECPGDSDCPSRIYAEGIGLATQLERQAQESLDGLEQVLLAVADIPGRKAVVVVSAGLLVSDRTDGRPDVGDVARIMGQTAARANATVYTVHVDTTSYSGSGSASQKGTGSSQLARDRALYGNWLSDFSQSAGGQLLYVPTGTGDFAFERILRETSGHYLLGVEPAAVDRDGKPRKLKVKVNRPDVSIRSRQWVVIPVKS